MNDESKYGPQTVEIEALLARANALTVGEMQELDALWGSAWGDTLDEAKRAAWYAVGGAAHDAAHGATWDVALAGPRDEARGFARGAAWGAVLALLARDRITPGGFTWAHYNLLTDTWRRVIGAVHTADAGVAV